MHWIFLLTKLWMELEICDAIFPYLFSNSKPFRLLLWTKIMRWIYKINDINLCSGHLAILLVKNRHPIQNVKIKPDSDWNYSTESTHIISIYGFINLHIFWFLWQAERIVLHNMLDFGKNLHLIIWMVWSDTHNTFQCINM